MRKYFMKTKRVGFSKWIATDLDLAQQLWGEAEVTQFLNATGKFTGQEIHRRLMQEIDDIIMFQIQYWPIFELSADELIGCCGLRPFGSDPSAYELGFHLRKKYWGMGYATEAARKVVHYSFQFINADHLYAGHHPKNIASEKCLIKLGFQNIGKNFYEPTGLYHPSYELMNPRKEQQ